MAQVVVVVDHPMLGFGKEFHCWWVGAGVVAQPNFSLADVFQPRQQRQ